MEVDVDFVDVVKEEGRAEALVLELGLAVEDEGLVELDDGAAPRA